MNLYCAKCGNEVSNCDTCNKPLKRRYLVCAKERHYCNFKCCSHPYSEDNDKFETWGCLEYPKKELKP